VRRWGPLLVGPVLFKIFFYYDPPPSMLSGMYTSTKSGCGWQLKELVPILPDCRAINRQVVLGCDNYNGNGSWLGLYVIYPLVWAEPKTHATSAI
jgi:hypothetical protein